MTERSYGWRAEPEGHVWANTHHDLIGASAPMQDTPSVYRFRSGKCFQSSAACCVAEYLKRAVQIVCAALGIDPEFLISEMAAYINGRLAEHVGEDPESIQIADVGSIPALVLEAARLRGVATEKELPLNLATIDNPDVVTPAMLVRAYDMRGLAYAPIPTGPGIIEAMRQGLLRFQVPGIAIGVSQEFSAYAGDGTIQTLDPKGPGHMLAVLELDDVNQRARVDNWWTDPVTGASWGLPDGTGWISYEALESSGVRAAYLVQGPPQLQRKVAA